MTHIYKFLTLSMLVLYLPAFLFANPNIITDENGDMIVRDIDGNSYKVVLIGEQYWIAENLRVTKYNDGSEIPNLSENEDWADATSGAWAYFENNPDNGPIYGKMYNWFTTVDERNVCPEGWWVPSDEDFAELESFAGMPEALLNRTEDGGWGGAEENVAGKLKAVSELWRDPNEGAEDAFGFAMIPGSIRYQGGFFEGSASIDAFAGLWTTFENPDNDAQAFRRLMRADRTDVRRDAIPKKNGLYIRCLTDEFTPTSTEYETSIPTKMALSQNYPNPFNPTTMISFSVSELTSVRLTVYDILGRKIEVLVDDTRAPGQYEVNFDASNLTSGIYIYNLEAGNQVFTRRMSLIK